MGIRRLWNLVRMLPPESVTVLLTSEGKSSEEEAVQPAQKPASVTELTAFMERTGGNVIA